MADDYLAINRANWDSRAPVHVAAGYGVEKLLADQERLSGTVRFDLPRLGRLDGLDVVHLQCHIGTDTLSLARLGAKSVTGVDLSPVSLDHARDLARRAGASIEYLEADVYSAPGVLDGRTFDLVYTGIGALCWLPSIERWAATVARLLRPGGRLFIRDSHPMLSALVVGTVADPAPEREQQPWISGPGARTPMVEFGYYESAEPLTWRDAASYAGSEPVANPHCVEWNHGLGEIITAVLNAGLTLTGLVEHDSVPWNALPGLLTEDPATEEFRLAERPERLAATFTLTARKV